MKKSLKAISIYLILLALIFQTIPQQALAEYQQIDKENEIVVFADSENGTIELFEDESAEQVIMEIPDDTTVDFLEDKGELSLIRYTYQSEESIVAIEGYVRSSHIVPFSQAEQYRAERQNPQNELEKEFVNEEINENEDVIQEKSEPSNPKQQLEKEEQKDATITVQQDTKDVKALRGVALKNPTNVYADTSLSSGVLKSYKQGHILKYESYNQDWYKATVYINGKPETGYIYTVDVDSIYETQARMEGVSLKQPVPVYAAPSQNSQVLKSYNYNHKLIYRSFSSQWYEATVYINGKPRTGYIYVEDVGKHSDAPTVKGIALTKTNVYRTTSRNPKIWKSYNKGHILKYRSYNNNWFKATVYINGKAHTGYIHRNDVETTETSPSTLKGVSIKSPTYVYRSASKNSSKLKSYKYGHILKFRSFSNEWYEAAVYINGKAKIGYIHKQDVKNTNSKLKGYALANSTAVYSKTSKNSTKLKTYKKGHVLQYQPYNSNWFKATVYVNGKRKTGFIHVKDVGPNASIIQGYAKASPTSVYSKTSKSSAKLKSYKKGQRLKYKPYNSTWYVATVYINGKARTGYIHKNDVTDQVPALTGYAVPNPTYVYSSTSRNAKKLKSYRRGHKLKYRPYNSKWYKATVYVNGKAQTGYIHAKDITSRKASLNSPTYIDGVLIASKKYPLPASFAPGESTAARNAFNKMAKDARKDGFRLTAFSTYRTYSYQRNLYNRYVRQYGEKQASRFSAKPGQSEHQTGLAFDVGEVGKEHLWANDGFGKTKASNWIARNAHKYGFIVRYPQGKEHITGYKYEPWHLRYLGVNFATKVYKSGKTIEEYLEIH